jgi:predicted DCC family thiol-disulfide oxidoreductase YuxK
VQFVLEHERDEELLFAPIQSEAGRTALERVVSSQRAWELISGTSGDGAADSLVVIEHGQCTTHSTAALRIAAHLRRPLSWLAILRFVPKAIRDAGYRWFARHRYAWFGKADTCFAPPAKHRARFL